MSSSLVILFGVVKQFGKFWIWSETECKIPTEYGLQHNSPFQKPSAYSLEADGGGGGGAPFW